MATPGGIGSTSIIPILAAGERISQTVGLLALLLGALVVVSLLLVRLRQSLLVGYFLCGVVAANAGLLEWFEGKETTAASLGIYGELGVVLLMFTLGIEFSLSELKHMRRAAIFGGGVQVLLTWGIAFGAAMACRMDAAQAAVLGVAVALSSTAVSMKAIQDLGETASPSGRTTLAIALFQDLAVILFMLIMPAFLDTHREGNVASAVGLTILNAFLFLFAAWLLGRFFIPRIMLAVSRTRSRELFTLLVFALCAGVAWMAHLMGLNLALGAFVAGLVVSESMYSHRVLADVLPFKDLFLTLFFVFIGLTVDLSAIAEHWPLVLGATVILILVKAGIVGLSCRALGLTTRSTARAMAALCSTGEFSLVLMAQAGDLVPWNPAFSQVFVVSTALSMALVPTLVRWAPALVGFLENRGWIREKKSPPSDLSYSQKIRSLHDHAVLCGYGPVGQRLHHWLVQAGIETLVVELNADTVRRLQQRGVCVLFADAAHQETWNLAAIEHARFVAFTFPESRVAFQATRLIRDICPKALILARARFASDVTRLEQQGVNVVVLDEAESSHAMVRAAEAAFAGAPRTDTPGEDY